MDPIVERPEDRDIDALVELYRACDGVYAPGTVSEREDIAWRWRTAEFDRSRDAWIARVAGRIVAYAWVFEGLADVRIHPGHRGRGLGRRLLELVEGRGAEQGSRDGFLRQNVPDRMPDARAFLEAHGYVYSHHYTMMAIRIRERPVVPVAPDGVTVRTYELGPDDAPVHEAFNRAWSQYEGDRWQPEPLARWMEAVESEDFDPRHWHLAVEGGEVVAICLGERYGDTGWIQYLGTVPEHRGRGLGRLMLLQAFAAFHDDGARRVELSVSSENIPAARALYDSAGMQEALRFDNLKKPIDSCGG